MRRVAIPLLVLALAACNREAPEPEAIETEVPEELIQDAPPVVAEGDSVGTPMEERVATIGLLNKRNNISQDLEMKPGEARRVGNVVVRLSACEKTAPWEVNRRRAPDLRRLGQVLRDALPG